MAVCSFLGHAQIYDADISSRLQNAVENIIQKDEKTEFLIYLHSEFDLKCFQAVLKAKANYPDRVSISMLCFKKPVDNIFNCVIDRILPLPSSINPEEDGIINQKKFLRWILQKSAYLISCLYRQFYEHENRLLDYAEHLTDLHIIDITSEETRQAILQNAVLMSDRERFIFDGLNNGSSRKEIADSLKISTNRVPQILNHGERIVRQHMQARYHQILKKHPPQTSSCSLFSMGEVTAETLEVFERIAVFLISTCGITHFRVASNFKHSGFMYVLKRLVKEERIIFIEAAVENEDYMDAEMISKIAGDSDFCVFDASDIIFAEKITQYAQSTKKVLFIDIRGVCTDKTKKA